MAIELKDGQYVARFFFISKAEGCDVLAMLYRDEDDGWRFDFRLRVHVDDKVHDSDDPKFWRRVTMGSATERLAVFECKKVFDHMADELGGEVEEVVVESDDAMKVAEALAAQPWADLKWEKPHAQA